MTASPYACSYNTFYKSIIWYTCLCIYQKQPTQVHGTHHLIVSYWGCDVEFR